MISKNEWNLLKKTHQHKETAFVSAYINSPCYHLITWFLIAKNITPNQVSISTIFLAIGASFAYIYGNFIAGGILVQLINIVDGVDGEIARIKHIGSPYGEIIDSLSDRVVEIILCLGIGYGVWNARESVLGWWFGLVGIIGFLMGNYLTELGGARAGKGF